MREDIQSLRAIAVVFVLGFHLWDDRVASGFLGVDIFFVISGYIMYMLLGSRSPLNLTKIVDFYYRRIKRIVPLYFCIIIIILVVGLFFVAPIEYHNLFKDAWTSATFCSNFLDSSNGGYFDLRGEFSYFKHTWSLSVEIQFYIIVPLLFYLFEWLNKSNKLFKFVLMGIIGVASFALQSWLDGDKSHMLLVCRLWQFMCGFLTFHLHESGILSVDKLFNLDNLGEEELPKTRGKKINNFLLRAASEIIKGVFVSALVGILFIESVYNFVGQLHRLGVVLLTMLIMVQIKPSYFLELKPLVALGDCSYSVYLVHWPIFTLHRYWYSEIYVDSHSTTTLIVGLQLICASFVFGYLIETIFKFLIKHLRSWISLLVTLFALVLIMVPLLILIKNKEPKFSYESVPTPKQISDFEANIDHLYNLRKNNITTEVFTKEQISQLNMELHLYSVMNLFCKNKTRSLPIADQSLLKTISLVCHEQGTGTKNVVLIGNSHARALAPGVAFQFRHIYKNFVIFEREYCMPYYNNHVWENTKQDKLINRLPMWIEWSRICPQFERDIISILESWQEPIDVIVVAFEYYINLNPEFDENNKMEDDYFRQMQNFYSKLNSIAKEVVFVPGIHMDWEVEPLAQLLQQHLYFDRELDLFEVKASHQYSRLSNVRRRIDQVECDKCVKIEWSDVWCSKEKCEVLFKPYNINYNRDAVHINTIGARMYGKLLLDKYEEKMGIH